VWKLCQAWGEISFFQSSSLSYHLCRSILLSPNLLHHLMKQLDKKDPLLSQSIAEVLSNLAAKGDLPVISFHMLSWSYSLFCRWFCATPPSRFLGQCGPLAHTTSNMFFWATSTQSFCKARCANILHACTPDVIYDADDLKKEIVNSAIVPVLLEMRQYPTSWHAGTIGLLDLGLFN